MKNDSCWWMCVYAFVGDFNVFFCLMRFCRICLIVRSHKRRKKKIKWFKRFVYFYNFHSLQAQLYWRIMQSPNFGWHFENRVTVVRPHRESPPPKARSHRQEKIYDLRTCNQFYLIHKQQQSQSQNQRAKPGARVRLMKLLTNIFMGSSNEIV